MYAKVSATDTDTRTLAHEQRHHNVNCNTNKVVFTFLRLERRVSWTSEKIQLNSIEGERWVKASTNSNDMSGAARRTGVRAVCAAQCGHMWRARHCMGDFRHRYTLCACMRVYERVFVHIWKVYFEVYKQKISANFIELSGQGAFGAQPLNESRHARCPQATQAGANSRELLKRYLLLPKQHTYIHTQLGRQTAHWKNVAVINKKWWESIEQYTQ